MYQAIFVKSPTKLHRCQYCGKSIKNNHIKVTGVYDSSFYSYRMHNSCFDNANYMCGSCTVQDLCTNDNAFLKCKKWVRKEFKNEKCI